jgi:hypothetical protein
MKLAATLALVLFAAGAPAQTVYRCGTTYTDAPCPEGRIVAAADPRSGAERQAAKAVVQRDHALGRELAAQREARERELRARGPGLTNVGPVAELRPKVLPKTAKAKTKPKAKAGAPGTYRGAVLASR